MNSGELLFALPQFSLDYLLANLCHIFFECLRQRAHILKFKPLLHVPLVRYSLLAQCREKIAQTPSSATACTCLVQGRQQPARRRKDGANEVRPHVGWQELPRVEQVGRRKGQKV